MPTDSEVNILFILDSLSHFPTKFSTYYIVRNIILAGLVIYALVAVIFVVIFTAGYPLRYRDEITAASEQFGVDRVLIASVIRAESGFNRYALSSKGAVGLMQILPTTASYINTRMNLGKTNINLADPETNIILGTAYLRYLLDRFEDLRTAIIAYNAGEGRVSGWLVEFGVETHGKKVLNTSPYPATNAYVQRVLNGMNMYRFRFR